MERMRFEQFTDAVVNNIKDYLPGGFADASVELQTITKNNDHKRHKRINVVTRARRDNIIEDQLVNHRVNKA